MARGTHQRRARRRTDMAGAGDHQDEAQDRVFDACCELLIAARDLESAAAARGAGGAAPPSLGCLGETFDALANAALLIRDRSMEQPRTEAGREPLFRLLYAVDQNLRFASQACDRAREAAGAVPDRST